MKSFVFRAFLAMPVLVTLAACNKEPPKKPVDEPKKTTPVPSDMVFNDFVPPSGGAAVVGVKMDGGLEAGLGAGDAPAEDPSAGAADEAGKLHVIESGSDPRAPRKYAFVANKAERRVITVRQSQSREGAGPAPDAAFALTADFTPKVVRPTGTKLEMKVVKVDMPDLQGPQKAQIMGQLSVFNGLTGTFEVSPRGDLGEVDFKADERMAGAGAEIIIQSLQQALELVVPPFPDAPIGVGAKWERKIERKEHGMDSASRHTFTLTELSGDGGTITVDAEVSVPKHAVQARGVPPGATEEVKGKGSYTYAFKLNGVATKVTGEMSITRRIEVPDGKGGKQTMSEVTKLKNQLEPAGGGAR